MNIIKQGDPRLNEVSLRVHRGEDCRALADDMMYQLQLHNGLGLAAPQLGILKRVIIVRRDNLIITIINPDIIKYSKGKKLIKEGCLSVPDKQVWMKRYIKVTVIGFDLEWNPIKIGGKSLNAAVLQHEIDHLNGVLIA